jgi:predicted oxidoreductase
VIVLLHPPLCALGLKRRFVTKSLILKLVDVIKRDTLQEIVPKNQAMKEETAVDAEEIEMEVTTATTHVTNAVEPVTMHEIVTMVLMGRVFVTTAVERVTLLESVLQATILIALNVANLDILPEIALRKTHPRIPAIDVERLVTLPEIALRQMHKLF